MTQELDKEIGLVKRNSYAVQLTNGDTETYNQLIRNNYPEPVIEVDCSDVTSFKDFKNQIYNQISYNENQFYSETTGIHRHIESNGGTILLRNYHSLPPQPNTDIAVFLKSTWEKFNFTGDNQVHFVVTTNDTGHIFKGNGDLTCRVRTVKIN